MLDRTCSSPSDLGADGPSGAESRGLIHDLGHGLATLSCLVDGMSTDPDLPLDVRRRAELMEKQLDLLRSAIDVHAGRTAVVDVRELLGELVTATALTTSTWIALRPGPPLGLRVERTALWRMVTNTVDNAVRAAGPGGRVELSAERGDTGAIRVEIADDGPGFGSGPPGTSACGLGILSALAETWHADVRVRDVAPHGTRVLLVFPPAATAVPGGSGGGRLCPVPGEE